MGHKSYFEKEVLKTPAASQEAPGVPLRREPTTDKPYKARSARNETPMYVRPYLEDPIWLQPDDSEMA